MSTPEASSHRRRNALTGEWVLVSPHRTLRPWVGQQEPTTTQPRLAHDPGCYLCPGNSRAGGHRNPVYKNTYVFPNDYPALTPSSRAPDHPTPTPSSQTVAASNDLFRSEAISGECRVLCYSPRHDLSLGELPTDAVADVVRSWKTQFEELDSRPDLAYTLIFENRGEMMGASNPHPHGQIWSTTILPDEVHRERTEQRSYYERHQRPLLQDYLQSELQSGTRVLHQNDHWVALIPYWAVWPFELLLLPRRPLSAFADLSPPEEGSLADALREITATYDRVFEVPFPYSMGWHPRPSDGHPNPEWVLHAHFYPPLLRSATVRKFQVGFEMLGMSQRDLTPEIAAERLRAAAARR